MPTFGRPRSATRRGPPSASSVSFGASGSASRIRSSRSPLPRPCSALTGTGSPSPSDHSAATSGSALVSSTLLAATTIGLPDRRSTAATAASASVTPTVASTTNRTASAASTATLAWAATRAARLSVALGRGFPAAGIDQRERPPVPDGVVGDPVPGHSGGVLHDRLPAAQDAVDQRGLAHVGAAHDGHHGHGLCRWRKACLASVSALRYRVCWRGCGTPARSRASRTMISITWSRSSRVESISTASSAFALCAASSRSRRS